MSLQASQPYKCTIPTWQLCQAQRATLKVGVTCLPYFQKYVKISHVLHLWWLLWLLAGFHQLSMSALISSHQCNSTMTIMSSWSGYVKSYEAKHRYELPSPTNAQFQHDSCVRLNELPSKLVSNAYLILRNKWDISILHLWWLLVTSSRVSPIFCLTWSAVISVTQLWQSGFHQFSLSDLISSHQCNSTVTVMSSWNRYIKSYEAKHHYELPSPTNAHFRHDSCVGLEELPSKLVSHAYLISEISKISHILHLWWLLGTSSRVSPTFSFCPDQRSSV